MFNPEQRLEKSREEYRNHEDYVDMGKLAALEDELNRLKEENNIETKRGFFLRFIDDVVSKYEKKTVSRKKYIRLAISIGWFTGAHRFYAGQKIRGLLYLLFFWTGIPFAMTLIDLMIVLPMKADENGCISI